jgi:hypothetical protein
LQIVTIKIALSTPDYLLRHLDEALQDISERLAKMEDNDRRPLDRNILKTDSEDPLIGLAQDALLRGTTLYKASIAGSIVSAEPVMGSGKATSIERWMDETGDVAQHTHAPRVVRSRSARDPDDVGTPKTRTRVEGSISDASNSDEITSDAGSSSWSSDSWCYDHSQFEPLSVPGIRPASSAGSSDLCRPPSDFSRPLNEWDRSEIVSWFMIQSDGRLETLICTGTNLEWKELSSLEEGEDFDKSDVFDVGGKRKCGTLALHLAVLFQDLHLVESLLNLGHSPNLSAQLSDRKPLRDLRTPIDISIASHCEPITKVLLKHGAELNPTGKASPFLLLFARTSLNLWPSTDLHTYMRVLGLLLAASRYEPQKLTKSVLHQICDLLTAWFHLRRPLVIFALDYDEERVLHAPSSPLHVLVEIRDSKTLRFFLKTSDAQYLDDHLQRKNEGGRSPLGTAIGQVESGWARSLDIVQALLQQGASLDDTSVVSPLPLSSPRSGGFFRVGFRGTTIRDIAMRSNGDDLKELVAKF